jgi:hypothetical protein
MMLADKPLPKGHTARVLAEALREAGAPGGMVRRAERGYYHDYLSPLALPEIALVMELRREASKRADGPERAALLAVAKDVIDGVHDASSAEADEWGRSADGRAAFGALLRRDGD